MLSLIYLKKGFFFKNKSIIEFCDFYDFWFPIFHFSECRDFMI
jgi:hypothetical protein